MKRVFLTFLAIFIALATFSQVAPSIPEQIIFAGEKVKFDRADIREHLDREIITFTYMHSSVIMTLKRANRYFDEIEKILKEEGVPDDLKYLMVIESNVNPLAVSPAGAAGLWQLMPSTAREYGLEVNDNVDERFNIELSTRAACKYLKNAKKKFGKWSLAAAAYNAGQNKISKELEVQECDNYYDLYLTQETQRYFYRILAAKMLFKDPLIFGFNITAQELYPPYKYKEVTVSTAIGNLAAWAKKEGITYAQLKELNPWLRGRELKNKSGKKYKIRVIKKESIYYKPNEVVWSLN